jgi:hypothetical protein
VATWLARRRGATDAVDLADRFRETLGVAAGHYLPEPDPIGRRKAFEMGYLRYYPEDPSGYRVVGSDMGGPILGGIVGQCPRCACWRQIAWGVLLDATVQVGDALPAAVLLDVWRHEFTGAGAGSAGGELRFPLVPIGTVAPGLLAGFDRDDLPLVHRRQWTEGNGTALLALASGNHADVPEQRECVLAAVLPILQASLGTVVRGV